MIEVTKLASKKLKAYLKENNLDSSVRISMIAEGSAYASLGLALDKPKDTDTTYVQDGINYFIDNDLSKRCGAIKVDFIGDGDFLRFSVSSTEPLSGL